MRLGLTSFGGPIAHLGYFRDAFVVRRRWLSEADYADLVALCQFLPGPASSQVGFAIGLRRAGWAGAVAAWCGFTLPSALLLVLFASGLDRLQGPVPQGVLHGLKLVAVAVVVQAVLGMARSLCATRITAGIAALAILIVTLVGGFAGQIAAIVVGAALGLALVRDAGPAPATGHATGAPGRGVALLALAAFLALLALLPLIPSLAVADAFFRAGALVFGGGHVVLPLLERAVVAPGWVSPDAFLAGYGAAQAVPGPLFTFAAFLGAVTGGWGGAAIALIAIFLPGILILVAALPFWDALRSLRSARTAIAGTNAAVVGLLACALYDPVWTAGIRTSLDFALAAVAFVALVTWRAPSWAVVLALAATGGVRAALA